VLEAKDLLTLKVKNNAKQQVTLNNLILAKKLIT